MSTLQVFSDGRVGVVIYLFFFANNSLSADDCGNLGTSKLRVYAYPTIRMCIL